MDYQEGGRFLISSSPFSRLGFGFMGAVLMMMPLSPRLIASTITLDLETRYQTIVGWEATAWLGQWGRKGGYEFYRDELIDEAVNELGLSRLRVSVRSGFERPDDVFDLSQKGEIDSRTRDRLHYRSVNDNDNPLVADPAGFHWSDLDLAIEAIALPMKERLRAIGEDLYLNLVYIDFGISDFEQGHDPQEYAEFMSVAFHHMKTRYGFVPDAIQVKLEPDKINDNWTPSHMANAIVATGDRLAKEGFEPDFVAPSTTRAGAAVKWLQEMIDANPRVLEYLTELSYHRYGNPTERFLPGILAAAQQHGLRTSMGEWLKADYEILPYEALHNDLSMANVSSWQQYTLGRPGSVDGRGYFTGRGIGPDKVQLSKSARFLKQYFKYVRPGAVRIGTASDDSDLNSLAFINPDGGIVTIVKAEKGTEFSVAGLPPGTYGLVYTAGVRHGKRLPKVLLEAGAAIDTVIPAKGVLTIHPIAEPQ